MRINHVTILVKDKKKSEKFFTEVLGFKKRKTDKYLWIKVGKQYIHITENSGKPIPNTFYHFAIEINDLHDYLKKIKEEGVKVLKDKFQYFIRDPDGNLIEFVDKGNKFFK
tara:strand:+ start:385 stop:717 length:333 start_codon:yes stop_codon:yes gene_type:complete